VLKKEYQGMPLQFIELHQEGKIIAINRDSIRCVTSVWGSKEGNKPTRLILNRSAEDDNVFPFYVDESYAEVLELLNQD
jgi:hypothetical protein